MPVEFHFSFKKPAKSVSKPEGFSLNGATRGTVILIHGLTGTPNEMKFIAHYLHRQGYSVYCPRLAYHGEPLEILKKAKWQDFYDSVRTTFLNLDNQHSGPVFVGGLSMGALLALLLAEEFPNKISGVSCLSPTLFYDGWNVPWSRHLLPLASCTPLKYFIYFKEESPYGIKNLAVRKRIHEYYSSAGLDDLRDVEKYGYPYFPVALFAEMNQLIKRVCSKLSNVHLPVQLIQAAEDDMTSIKNSQFIHDQIASEMKEIFLLHDSYHVITADQERETVAEKVADFFSRVPVEEGVLQSEIKT